MLFRSGYDTNSAVLFPETVATRELAKFYWGGIFCDREAARYRRITASASELLKLALPADAEYLLANQSVTQESYMLWDLVHDRAHSHGDLPFDPFMIKQRMPFWMYALEELRCDLATFRETLVLEAEGERNLMTTLSDIRAKGYNEAFQQARDQFTSDESRRLETYKTSEQARQKQTELALSAAELDRKSVV